MTLPPFDGPLRQSTATLPGAGPAAAAPSAGGAGMPGAAAVSDGAGAGLGGGSAPRPPGSAGSLPTPGMPAAAPPFAPVAAGEIEPLNLARRPFVNTRPVQRVAAILWLAGVALLIVNVMLFMRYLTNSQATRGKLAAIESEIAREQRDSAALLGRLGNLGLDQQNREVTFLNRKIDERTFSWSLLFERMAEVLPDQVRLLRLKPSNVVQREIGLGPRPSARELNPPPVSLNMHCEAKDDEAVLRFVDNLFAHPVFSEPNLESEERMDSGLLRFDVTVQYQPNAHDVLLPRAPAAKRPARRSESLEGAAALAPANGVAGGAAGPRQPGAGAAAPLAPPIPPTSPIAAQAPVPAAPAAASPAGADLVPVAPPQARPFHPIRRPPPIITSGGRRIFGRPGSAGAADGADASGQEPALPVPTETLPTGDRR
jgi:hypothetical protein